MKTLDIPKSGKRRNTVAFKSRFGQVEREHVSSAKPASAAVRRARSAFGAASYGWNYLTAEQYAAWRASGRLVRSHPRGGQSGPLTGQMFFTAINRNQALIGLAPLLDPPERPLFEQNPVKAFTITQGRRGMALKLSVPKAPTAHILVFASRPYNAGRQYCDEFIYLGVLPATARGECDIAKLYLAKHPAPWLGSRVFIYTLQQIDGWRDLPQRIEAVFCANQGATARPKRLRSTPAAP